MMAAKNGHLEVTSKLIDARASVDTTDRVSEIYSAY